MESKPISLLRGKFTIKGVYRVRGWGGDLRISAEESEGFLKVFYSKGEGKSVTQRSERVGKECLGKRVQIEYTSVRTGRLEHFFDRTIRLNLETPRSYNQIIEITPLDKNKS